MEIQIVERTEFKALTIKVPGNGQEVRKGWQALQKLLHGYEPSIDNQSLGYVFVPEWQWATGVRELWVGVELKDNYSTPEGTEMLVLPAKNYAVIRVNGDRKTMNHAYTVLNDWIKENGFERDLTEGTYSIEANPLFPINPFDIPADQITYFDYTIYAPLVGGNKHSNKG